GSITDLAVSFREVDLREADFAGRLTIAIAAFPRRVIAGPPRAVLVALAWWRCGCSRSPFRIWNASGRFAKGACCCTAIRFMLATRRFPDAVPRRARRMTVPLEFRLSASGLCRSCAPGCGLAGELTDTPVGVRLAGTELWQRAHP